MRPERLELSASTLGRLNPFFLWLDVEGHLVGMGPSMRRVLPEASPGDALHTLVRVRRPLRFQWSPQSLRDNLGQPWIAEVLSSGIRLRGQLLEIEGGHGFILVSNPWVQDLDELAKHGLKLGDFPLQDSAGDLLLNMGTIRSALTDLRQIEGRLKERNEELLTAKEAAEAASRAKSTFLAVISHEIRTPMNGLGSMADLLLGSELSAEQRESAEIIRDCSETLRVLLNDILDLSKIEADHVSLESLPFQPERLARDTCKVFGASARERGIELRFEMSEAAGGWALGDPNRIRQVLSNLIGNALKFTEEGSVTVCLDVIDGEDDGEWMRIDVIDTGCGIQGESQDGLFDPFTQADNSVARQFGGTGLGLAICRQLARLMGGDTWLDASSSDGSTFSFTLRLERTEAPTRNPESDDLGESKQHLLRGLRVLVADDNRVNVKIAERLLRRLEIDCVSVENGKLAVEAFEDGEFDAVLLDLEMPLMGGIEAARKIRELPNSGDVPLIAFTANAEKQQLQVVREAGMVDLLTKPVRLGDLRSMLARWALHGQGREAA